MDRGQPSAYGTNHATDRDTPVGERFNLSRPSRICLTFCQVRPMVRSSAKRASGLARTSIGWRHMGKLAEVSWPQAVVLLVIAGSILFFPDAGPIRLVVGGLLVAFVVTAAIAKWRMQHKERGEGNEVSRPTPKSG
jgi:hypothetical protein